MKCFICLLVTLNGETIKIMKRFFAFVKKEFFHIFRDVRTVMILLLMPMAQILLFGFALSSEVTNINVAILDNSKDTVTRKIINRIDGNKYFNIVKNIDSVSDLNGAFDEGKVDLVLVFQDKFASRLSSSGSADIAALIDASDPNKAYTISIYVTNLAALATKDAAPLINLNNTGNTATIIPNIRMLYNPQGESTYSFVPGLMGLVIILICSMMTSISIVREKESGSMEVLLISPMKPIAIIAAKLTPYFAISCVNLVSIMLIAVYALGMKIVGNVGIVMCFCLLYVILSLSIGLFVSTVSKTQVTAMLISGMVFLMPIMMLSGMMFPIESMPKILQWMANIIPAKWFVIGIKKVMIEGLGFASVIQEIGILALMTAIIVFASLKKFKNRLDY